MTPATSSSGLFPNLVSQQPCIPPNRDDWDYLFQPMFDEYFTPPPNAISDQEAVALRADILPILLCQLPLTRMLHHQVLHQHKNKINFSRVIIECETNLHSI
ncbi:hypothetical protein Tco_1048338 [Tanacetum coccineum]